MIKLTTWSVSVACAAGALLAAASVADAQMVRDRVEDRIDRVEDRIDRRVTTGPLDRIEDRWDRRENYIDRRTGPYRPAVRWGAANPRVVVRPANVVIRPGLVAPRVRIYRGVRIHRIYGPTIYGYGFYISDEDAFPWLAFTAITLRLLDRLTEEQVRYHEQAQIEATSVNVGQTIVWESGDAQGSVTPIRSGRDQQGRTCREFHQTVTIGGYAEDAYGVACLDDSGAWRIVQ